MSALLRLVLALGLLATPGCRSTEPAPPAPGAASRPTWSLTTAAGSWRVDVVAVPSPVPLNEPFELEVELTPVPNGGDGEGPRRAFDGSEVELAVDASMPAHRHGMLRAPRVEPLGGGRYQVRGLLLHMGGEWLLTFDVTRGGLTERAETVLAPR